MKTTITGNYHTWNLNGKSRSYADIHLPYRDAIQFVVPVAYRAITGKGEQRELFLSHVRKMREEIENSNYTPTQMSASMRKSHLKALNLDVANRTFSIEVDHDDPLAQVDGSHRYGSLDLIVRDLKERIKKADDEESKTELQKRLDEVMNLQIGIRVYFDGDPQRDFVNLQAGRPVDRSHMLSLRIQKGMLDSGYKTAFGVAKLLHKQEGSPFQNLIRFDSKEQNKDSLLKLVPISTFLAKASSDLATSLVGLAKVGEGKDQQFLAHCILAAYQALEKQAPGVLESGKPLTPIRNGGTKGSATMLIGLGICVAHRLITTNKELPDDQDLARLVATAEKLLNTPVSGNFSGPVKRNLIGEFARDYLSDLATEFHDGIPLPLLKDLAPSAYDATPLPKPVKTPKPPKATKRKKKADAAETAETPAVTQPAVTPEPKALQVPDPEVTPQTMASPTAPWDAPEPVAVATDPFEAMG